MGIRRVSYQILAGIQPNLSEYLGGYPKGLFFYTFLQQFAMWDNMG